MVIRFRQYRVARSWVAGVVLAGLAAGSVDPANARQPTREELEERVRRLERIIQDQGLDQPQTSPPAPSKAEVEALVDEKLKSQKVLAGWQDGFFLQSPDGDYQLKLRGLIHADARVFPFESGDTGTDSLFLRRVRPIFEGKVAKYFDFRIMPDFAGGTTTLLDAYGRVTYFPAAQLTAGKFKSPLSLERLQSANALTFIERSIANSLAPNREVAITLGGSVLDGRLSYEGGVFNGAIDGGSNDGDVTSDKDFQGRLWAEPFKTSTTAALRGLGFGIAGTYGTAKEEDYGSLTYRTSGRSRYFRFDTTGGARVLFDGTRGRIAPQAYWYWGPFGLLGEYIRGETDLVRVTVADGVETRQDGVLETDGWVIQASWVLTGEKASYKQVIPDEPFDPRNGKWGAFEVGARASQVNVDDGIFDRGFASRANGSVDNATAWTAGVNWYLNKWFKFQINYERTEFDGDLEFSGKPRGHEDVLLSRFQILY